MVRTMNLRVVRPERLLAAALLMLAATAGRLAARLLRDEPRREPHREYTTIELDGRLVGALYEDGRLVAVLPGIVRL